MSDGKILVASDTHGCMPELRWLLEHEPDARALFFLGDGLRDLSAALATLAVAGRKPQYPVYRVRGNCDAGAPDPSFGLAPVCGVLFFYTHGHLYGVKSGCETLAETAAARGADVALFGHTHTRALENQNLPGIPTLFNPGSVLSGGTYGVITVQGGHCRYEWRRIPDEPAI